MEVPRAKGLYPDFKRGESYVTLLHFVLGQSGAAAQGTALALGTYHSVVLLTGADAEATPTARTHEPPRALPPRAAAAPAPATVARTASAPALQAPPAPTTSSALPSSSAFPAPLARSASAASTSSTSSSADSALGRPAALGASFSLAPRDCVPGGSMPRGTARGARAGTSGATERSSASTIPSLASSPVSSPPCSPRRRGVTLRWCREAERGPRVERTPEAKEEDEEDEPALTEAVQGSTSFAARADAVSRPSSRESCSELGSRAQRASTSSASSAPAAPAPGASASQPRRLPSSEVALYAFGRGFHGQLGRGNHRDCHRPMPVMRADRDGRPVPLRGAGSTAPLPGASSSSSSRSPSSEVQVAVVAAGSSHTTGISRHGELFSWGLASSGELGHGGWTPIEVSVPRLVTSLARTRVVSVAAGANHTLAISEAGQLWSCGRGRHGQLGHGHLHDEGVLRLVEALAGELVVSAAAGRAHSVALAADGKVFSWGDARRGQLGHAGIAAFASGRRLPGAEGEANAAAQGGGTSPAPVREQGQGQSDAVPPPASRLTPPLVIPIPQPVASLDPVYLHSPARVTAVAAGGDHTFAVTVGGGVLAWGANDRGQLGVGDRIDRAVPTDVPLPRGVGSALQTSAVEGRRGEVAPKAEQHPPAPSSWGLPAAGSSSFVSAAMGMLRSLGTPPRRSQAHVASSSGEAPARRLFESGQQASAAPLPVAARAVQVTCGGAHTLLLLQVAGRRVVCAAGDNSYGQLGLGDRELRTRFCALRPLGCDVACVAAGDSHCAAVGAAGELLTWGRGDCGQLGLGDDKGSWRPKRVPGVAVVHPDRTLRRNRKPVMRALVLKADERKAPRA